MFARMKHAAKQEKGFTLIELLAVIIIIGIIAAIAVPMIGGLLSKTKDDADKATAKQFYEAARLYVTAEKGGDFKTNNIVKFKDLKGKYLPNTVKLSDGTTTLGDDTSTVEFNEDGSLKQVTLATGKSWSADDLKL